MTILVALLIGVAFGSGVGLWFKRLGDYLLIDILIGLSGAILGMAIDYFAHSGSSLEIVSIDGVLAAAIGAGIALLLFQLVLKLPKKQHKSVVHPDSEES